MGVKVTGLDALIRDLEQVPAKAPDKFGRVIGRGAMNIKAAWKRRWSPVGAAPHQLPHVARGIGYDTTERATYFFADIGVSKRNPQASLAHFPEFGSINNAPLPGGSPSLREEDPRFVKAVGDAAIELLEGGSQRG
jgi:hypothetical protein